MGGKGMKHKLRKNMKKTKRKQKGCFSLFRVKFLFDGVN
jgi:hypothetical protein